MSKVKRKPPKFKVGQIVKINGALGRVMNVEAFATFDGYQYYVEGIGWYDAHFIRPLTAREKGN